MAVQPISPQEALDAKITSIPDEVIETVNAILCSQATRNPRIVIMQNDLCTRIIGAFNAKNIKITKDMIYQNNWLDFEPFYEKAGWKVVYDKPAYCETYEANFTFSKA